MVYCLCFLSFLLLKRIEVLSRLSGLLADEGISISALSTFKTDYILIKSDEAENAQKILKEAGYNLV
ncbi:hypothetical protein A0O21_05360 [Streptococcus pantholopis]|uniref:ACT domain-containing protein n=1 Tax=Streptococcus pantholopis TaxID=1811193 RepID=A0A172Q7X2_9STRE|nr:hypothetical protein A0O21_05360 [Streptococcus pantholopis]